jgi:ribonuclease BN (tRNA processing enzyme)
VEVTLDSGHRVVIDGGTGMRLLGMHLEREGKPVHMHLLLTHGHWDHLLGIPFFSPIYKNDTEMTVDGWVRAFQALTRIFDNHMGNGFFPIAFEQLKAQIHFVPRLDYGSLEIDGTRISAIKINHPQGGLGFRFQAGGSSFVFITDNELGAARGQRFPDFVRFCRGCDLLIHDAQYLPEEMPERKGWGHSTYEEVVRLAGEAGAKKLLLTHHDPVRTDTEVKAIVAKARDVADRLGHTLAIDAAYEGGGYQVR